MLKLGIISDTHWDTLAQARAGAQRLMGGAFANIDAIIHAGDMVHPDLDMVFAPHAFYAVRGNMDAPSNAVPLKRILRFAGVNIGVIHGWGSGSAIELNALREFDTRDIDILIYGHSHYPTCRWNNGLLLFNPGSAVQPRRTPFHSVGLISISTGSGVQDQTPVSLVPAFSSQIRDRKVFNFSAKQQVVAEIIDIDAEPQIV